MGLMFKSKPRVLISTNTSWNLVNFRSGLIQAFVANGYEVIAAAPSDIYVGRLEVLGCRYRLLPMDNKGTNLGLDLLLFWRYLRILRQERPDVFLGYTVKPNVYGSLAAHILRIPVVNNISGLGAVFIRPRRLLTRIVSELYRFALGRSVRVFFQNEDDRCFFVKRGLVQSEVTDLVPGSGVDLDRFSPVSLPSQECEQIKFILVARMLWDKGVGEYVEAARRVRQHFPKVEFCLLGFLDVQNPAAISWDQMRIWVNEGVVNYLGESSDVRPHIVAADCVVLPSYREGLPRTLLEAAAMGRPIITTDTAGCREVVVDRVSGFLCRLRDADDLADKMEQMIELSTDDRADMGKRGRKKVEQEFDEQLVITTYLRTIKDICG